MGILNPTPPVKPGDQPGGRDRVRPAPLLLRQPGTGTQGDAVPAMPSPLLAMQGAGAPSNGLDDAAAAWWRWRNAQGWQAPTVEDAALGMAGGGIAGAEGAAARASAQMAVGDSWKFYGTIGRMKALQKQAELGGPKYANVTPSPGGGGWIVTQTADPPATAPAGQLSGTGAIPGTGSGVSSGAGGSAPILRDPEGRLLTARIIAGQRTPGGPDTPLSQDEVRQIALRLGRIVDVPNLTDPTTGVPVFGKTTLTSPEPPAGTNPLAAPLPQHLMELNSNQPRAMYPRTLEHETGHELDNAARNIDDVPLPRSLLPQFRAASNARRPDLWDDAQAPLVTGMTPAQVEHYRNLPTELSADAFAHYMHNPADMRTLPGNNQAVPPVAPDVAKWIRGLINDDPRLNDLIQFNGLFPGMLLGGGGAAGGAPLLLRSGEGSGGNP